MAKVRVLEQITFNAANGKGTFQLQQGHVFEVIEKVVLVDMWDAEYAVKPVDYQHALQYGYLEVI